MKKKWLLVVLAAVVLAVVASAGFYFSHSSGNGTATGEGLVLFYGEGCPHCEVLFAKLKETGLDKKIPMTVLESFHNEENSKKLDEAAKKCGMDPSQVGVPFLIDGSTCQVGDQPILTYLQQRK